MNMKKENLLNFIGYHEKWHSQAQNFRKKCTYSVNEFLIEEIFKRLNIKNGVFVEFGAWDGIHLSNTRKLFEEGWGGLLIEGSFEKYNILEKNYKDFDRVVTVNSFIDTKSNLIDDIFIKNLNSNIDFCSIDIDGLDLDIFNTFKVNLPKVVCIEGGQTLHPLYPKIPSHLAKNNIGQSLFTMNKNFESKGYRLLCAYQDAFFVKEEFFSLFNVDENLVNQYIDGLIALPRIPYLKELLFESKMSNSLIDQALFGMSDKDVNNLSSLSTKEDKMKWVDEYFELVKDNLMEMKL